MVSRVAVRTFVLVALVFALVGCDSPEEKAEAHYKRGMELLTEGDATAAQLEFRNALQQNQAHVGARKAYAGVLAQTGDARGAIGQYLQAVALAEDDGPLHLDIGRLAIQLGDYQTAATHVQRAFDLMPEDAGARELMASVKFRQGDTAAAVEMANGVLTERADSVPAELVLIADRMAADDFEGALSRTEAALERTPDDPDLNVARLTTLEKLGDQAGVGQQLQRMAELDPDNAGVSQALVQWHLSQGDNEGALAVLRQLAEKSPDDPTGYLNVAQFLLETQGPDAARAELQQLVDSKPEPGPYLRALAQLDFAQGRRDEAIAGLRKLTEGQEDTAEVRDLKVALAKMLLDTGTSDEAWTLVDGVLSSDPRNVEALKLRARRLIDQDDTEHALLDLNTALTEKPEDAETLTLMAAAHEREGAHDLAGQRLARAVEASNNGIGESLRYGRFLLADGRVGPAEDTVLDALRRNPNNLDLLVLLGQVHLQRRDFARVRQVAGTIRGLDTPNAAQVADGLELAALQAEGRTDEMVTTLQGLAESSEGDIRPKLALIQTEIAAGNVEAARAAVDAILAEDPQSVPGRLALAAIQVLTGQTAEAEATYKTLIADAPQIPAPHQGLVALLASQGKGDAANAALTAGLEATRRDSSLLLLDAQQRLATEDFEGAIADFQEIYDRDTSNVVIANNLASLLSSHRSDEASLERAFQVARRLRGTENPYFQDTYGWLLTQRQDYQQALTYLEPAAKALTGDALTQYHLAMTYYALERWKDAKAVFAAAVTAAGDNSDLPQIADAQAKIVEIDARPADADGAPPEKPQGG